jgi:nucleoside-diphosphate-sugar epimerase
MGVRIIADVLMVNIALIAALIIRLFHLIFFSQAPDSATYNQLLWNYYVAYSHNAWKLTLICLAAFYISGFYTAGRAYRGRYKALIVTQAVSLAYVLFGFLSYILRDYFYLPRGVLLMAWFLSIGLLITSRLWSQMWANILRAEHRLPEQKQEKSVRNILVIGGAGYIGSALLPRLLDAGYHVRLLDLLLYSTEPIQGVLSHPHLEIRQADFRQIDKVVEAMHDVDAVIHLGAIVGDPACALDEELTIEVNLMATRMIAEVAKGYGINRFIFASTCSVYGASDEYLDERSALKPVSLYARSKIASEQVLLNMTGTDFAPVILRFGTIYGLSGRTRFDLVVNLLTAKAVVDGEITLYGGNQWRPFLHVEDAALATMSVLEAPLSIVRKQIFNVGSDEQNYTITQVGEIIQKLVPTAKVIHLGADIDLRNYRVNFSKIYRALHFTPQWNVEKGVRQVLAALGSGKITNYHDARYSNVKFLSEEGTARLIRDQREWAYDLINESSSDVIV